MGVSNFSPIPAFRPSHCLYVRISNAASPRPVIIYAPPAILKYSLSLNIIHLRRRSSLHYLLYIDSKLRSLKAQNDNVRKRLFPKQTLRMVFSVLGISIDVFDPPCPHSHQPSQASDNLDWLSRLQRYTNFSNPQSIYIKNAEFYVILAENGGMVANHHEAQR